MNNNDVGVSKWRLMRSAASHPLGRAFNIARSWVMRTQSFGRRQRDAAGAGCGWWSWHSPIWSRCPKYDGKPTAANTDLRCFSLGADDRLLLRFGPHLLYTNDRTCNTIGPLTGGDHFFYFVRVDWALLHPWIRCNKSCEICHHEGGVTSPMCFSCPWLLACIFLVPSWSLFHLQAFWVRFGTWMLYRGSACKTWIFSE